MLQTAQSLAGILGLVAKGDRRAFAELYRATSAKLYAIVYRILQQRGLADEVLQEVYVKIWERAADFDATRASPITWMAAIARNRAIDEVRRKAPMSIEDAPEAADLPDEIEHPLDKYERGEELARVMACLEALGPDRRRLVLLAYYRGTSREALSELFSAPVATIKTWLHRSLAQLRTCLDR
jgi:RNA polymerase sigma-70 factor (ECF subfamily)